MIYQEYAYRTLCEDIFSLKKHYPFLQIGSIGKSLCGRSLYCVEIGSGDKQILFAGAFHGMERITAAVLMRFTEALAQAVRQNGTLCGFLAGTILSGIRLCLIPCVNPDGVEISIFGPQRAGDYAYFVREHADGDTASWQANARGVDLNHNFNADWDALRQLEISQGYLRPGPTRFGGYGPESEPETAALANFCRKRDFAYVLAFHTQGEEIYYRYGDATPPQAEAMAKALADASGYRLAAPEGIASMGGFKDWFIQCMRRPGFTIEAGRGRNPLPPSDFPALYQQLEPMLIAALRLS